MGIAAGGCAGLVNGVLGSYFRLPIFIVTLVCWKLVEVCLLGDRSQTIYIGPSIQALSLPLRVSGFRLLSLLPLGWLLYLSWF